MFIAYEVLIYIDMLMDHVYDVWIMAYEIVANGIWPNIASQ